MINVQICIPHGLATEKVEEIKNKISSAFVAIGQANSSLFGVSPVQHDRDKPVYLSIQVSNDNLHRQLIRAFKSLNLKLACEVKILEPREIVYPAADLANEKVKAPVKQNGN